MAECLLERKLHNEFAQMNLADVNKLHRDLWKDDGLKKVCFNERPEEVASPLAGLCGRAAMSLVRMSI